ncbi:MAG: hypothetical protein FJZ96_04075 [Chloroflexi bacterium]|nr:hypothetical protein [Chloroflexota bacterium]
MPERLTPEQERLLRLREQQLSARDPRHKRDQIARLASNRERATDRRITTGRVWRTVSHLWRGIFIGLLLGIALVIGLPALWLSPWALVVAIIVGLGLTGLFAMIGSLLDYRDNLKDLSR